MIPHPDEEIRVAARYQEAREALFSPAATRSHRAKRRHNRKPPDSRTPFTRDADRILHSPAYTRYIDKTQVFYLVENDHITHRVLHVQFVSKIARTIGRYLRLNEDLIEAIALGHDIGHAPYGHTGEQFLSKISKRHRRMPFSHNVQSVRFLDTIEDQDLTLQVLDGILCHNGESTETELTPAPYDDFAEYERRLEAIGKEGGDVAPMTPEACVVRFADTIAYIGRDIDDARATGLLPDQMSLSSSVCEVLGDDTRSFIDTLSLDLMRSSACNNECRIAYSDEVGAALHDLKEYNYQTIYNNPLLTSEREKVEAMYETVFSALLEDLEKEKKDSPVYTMFLDTPWVTPGYQNNATDEDIVIDCIAGMTDRTFEATFRTIVLPRKVKGRFS